MMPADELERRVRAAESQVVRLDERMDYGTRDRDLIRREMAEGFASIRAQVAEVDKHCEDRFKNAADAFKADHASKRGVTVAWIGGACLLIASIINSVAALTGGGGP